MNQSQIDPADAHALVLASDIHVLVGNLRRRLRQEAHLGDFTWSQAQVLRWLEREGSATVTTLAHALGVRPQSMGETLSTLKAAGHVHGAPNPADGRQTVLSLTDTCREKIKAARAAREDWLFRAIRTKLAPAEEEQLATGIALLKQLIAS
jgi:DNA-binding MarR family transcriptional regulator